MLGGVLRAMLLNHVEHNRHRHNDGDDDEAADIPGEGRNSRGAEEDQDKRIAKPREESRQQALRGSDVDPVRPDALEFGPGGRDVQPVFGGFQPGQQIDQGTSGHIARRARTCRPFRFTRMRTSSGSTPAPDGIVVSKPIR